MGHWIHLGMGKKEARCDGREEQISSAPKRNLNIFAANNIVCSEN